MTIDEFAEFDGAYVLGALSESERLAFEDHLLGCPQCRENVQELAELPGLLALVPADAFGMPAPSAVPLADPVIVLLATARARRNRRRLLATAVAAVAAACLVFVTVLIAHPHSSSPTPVAAPQVTMSALVPAPIQATADVRSVAWGTSIRLRCTYDGSGSYGSGVYTLQIQTRTGETDTLGTWAVLPGKVMNFTSGTAVQLADIKTITIGTSNGTPILQLSY